MPPTFCRLEARISSDLHALLKRAAELEGLTVTDFVVSAVHAAAQRTIEQSDLIRLSMADQASFARALLAPPAPTPGVSPSTAAPQWAATLRRTVWVAPAEKPQEPLGGRPIDTRDKLAQRSVIGLGAIASADARYNGLNPPDVPAINRDNDHPAAINVAPAGTLGGSATFELSLATEPTSSLRVALTNPDATEFSLDRTEVVFEPANWSAPQRVRATGVDDTLLDGDISGTIGLAPAVSTDARFNGIDPRDVPVVNRNDDFTEPAALVVTDVDLTTEESGGTGRIEIVDVRVFNVSSLDPGYQGQTAVPVAIGRGPDCGPVRLGELPRHAKPGRCLLATRRLNTKRSQICPFQSPGCEKRRVRKTLSESLAQGQRLRCRQTLAR